MSFGHRYVNKFLFDFTDGWTVGMVREWATNNNFNISVIEPNLDAFENAPSRSSLMVYTPTENEDHSRLNGYFCLDSEAREVYAPEGWEFVPTTPEEILV